MWGPTDYFNRSVYAKSGFRAAIEVQASSQVLIAMGGRVIQTPLRIFH